MRAAWIALIAATAVSLFVASCGGSDDVATETIAIRFSRFGPETMTVRAGEPVTFTLRNNDPIEHEWIIGTEDVHERHRTGTEPLHDEIPTEVTIPSLSTKTTTVTFDEPGEYVYVCHLPGHEAYGMRGVVQVEGSSDDAGAVANRAAGAR
jgi:plastocyanin